MKLSDGIIAEKVLDAEDCAVHAQKVLALFKHWRHRGTFYTLGASTYNDNVMDYMAIAHKDNAILVRHFGGLLQALADMFATRLKKEVIYLPTHGMPGFHIFDKTANGKQGSVHIDQPETRCWWPCKTSDRFTFTVPLELPQGHGGLNLYEGDHNTIKDHTGALPDPQYYPYDVGMIYIHDGQTIHQIANPVDMEENEFRITLQGHGATLEDGRVVLYF